MSLLVRSQLRFVAHAPWSAATALVGVALGVASVVAVHLISAAVVESLDAAAPPHLSGLSHVVERPGMSADDYFSLRERWRGLPSSGVEALVPLVEGRASFGERQVLVLGVDWLAMPSSGQAAPSTDPLTVSTDVLIGEAVLADETLDLGVGEAFTVGERRFRVAGVGDTGLGAAFVVDIAAAHHMLGSGPDAVHRVGLAVHDSWGPWRRRLDRLMPGFSAGLSAPRGQGLDTLAPGLVDDANSPGEAAEEDWRVSTVADQQPSAEFARAVLFNLGALGTLALLVAWFLIYQVGVIWLRRQHLVLERLHAIGVSHRALRRSFLGMFGCIGAIATVLGLGVGVVLAGALAELTAEGVEGTLRAGFGDLNVWVLAKAVVSGFGVCLLGGFGAFSREWRLREIRGWRSAVVPVLVLVIAAGILLEGTGVLGGFLAIFAMSLIGVALVSPALAALRRLTSGRGGSLLTRLALRDVARHPRMLGVALAALSLAVATSIGIALMVESFRMDFDRMLEVRLAGDLYIDVGDEDVEALRAWLDARPEVVRVSGFGRARVRAAGVPAELGYSRFDAPESARYGYPGALAAGDALISERLARDLDVAAGDSFAVAHGSLGVVRVFSGYGDTVGRLLVDVSSLDRLGVEAHIDRLTVDLEGEAAVANALADAIAQHFPGVEAEPRAELRALVLDIFDRTFAITQALTLVALLVAVVGTYNALTALRLHQAATAALLRAQGVTPGEERRITLIRAGTVGGVAMALALPLGFAMAWTLCTVINPRSFGWTVELHLPLAVWLSPLLLGLAAAALAGILPAPRERGALHEGA